RPSGKAKNETSLTHIRCGPGGLATCSTPMGSAGSCARAGVPQRPARSAAATTAVRYAGRVTAVHRTGDASEVGTELDADREGLVDEQARSPGDLRGDRAIVAQVRDLVGEILAEQGDLGRAVTDGQARVQQAIGRPLARQIGGIRGTVTAADVGIVELP